ncbi:YtxH domain-containing protein [Candidatus Uhrbacteria bacterium]|nr:YtxH domain-containing protein [Candidatus Uhrbacteria bacterium]
MAENKHFVKGAAIGAVLASIATLLLAPKAGKKTRSDVKKLVNSLSKKMSKEFASLSDLSRDRYEELVNRTMKEYTKGKKIAQDFIDDVSKNLKGNWKEVQKELKKK